MSERDLCHVVWRKSSYSGAGQNCVEVGLWRKSSLSGNGQNCVEVGVSHKSSLSGNGPDCVEVAALGNAQTEVGAEVDRLFLVRDSKDPDGPVLSFGPAGWKGFLRAVKSGSLDDLTAPHKM